MDGSGQMDAPSPTNAAERLSRITSVPRVVGDPTAYLFVTGLGGTGRDIAALTDDGANMYSLGGAMGAAATMGLGLAVAQPERRILVVTGDGELLMNLGSLATIGASGVSNFALLCVDNGVYGETGNQPTHTSLGTDLAGVARSCGFRSAMTASTEEDLAVAHDHVRYADGPCFVLLKVSTEDAPAYERNRDGALSRSRFRQQLIKR